MRSLRIVEKNHEIFILETEKENLVGKENQGEC